MGKRCIESFYYQRNRDSSLNVAGKTEKADLWTPAPITGLEKGLCKSHQGSFRVVRAGLLLLCAKQKESG